MANENDNKEMQLRRLALLLMSSVPDDPDDALKVLQYAQELVSDFMKPRETATIVRNRLHSIRGGLPPPEE